MKKLTLVLSIAAAISGSTFVNADEYSDSDVTLTKTVNVEKDLKYKGVVRISGQIEANGLGMAVVENNQSSSGNMTDNSYHDNDSSIGENAFSEATGNIGVNVAAGDNNVQANSAALASIDADFAFGSGDAEVFSQQSSVYNGVYNYGSTNTASVSGAAFEGASGNIGVNVASGNNNVQANNMALSSYSGNLGEASVSNVQMAMANGTYNMGVVQDSVEYVDVNLALDASGTYEGTATHTGAYYPEIWTGNIEHDGPGTEPWGHIDIDGDNATGDERLTFAEEGDLALGGTVSGQLPFFIQTVTQKTNNTASISGTAFAGASGNIGVNMASGTSNLQANSLALTAISAAGTIISE